MLIKEQGIENVIRMPVEGRKCVRLEVMVALAPESAVIESLIETLKIENFDYATRHTAERDTIQWLQITKQQQSTAAWITGIIATRNDAVDQAIKVAGLAKAAADAAAKARLLADEAHQAHSIDAGARHAHANKALEESWIATLKAHVYCEVALGQAQAIGIALDGELCRPVNNPLDGCFMPESLLPTADGHKNVKQRVVIRHVVDSFDKAVQIMQLKQVKP